MSEQTFQVMFLCNDERGNFTGRAEVVEIENEVKLVCQRERGVAMRYVPVGVKIGRWTYPCRDTSTWAGNVFWDSALLDASHARQLVARLLEGGWAVEEHAEEGPLADLLTTRTKP